MTVALTPRATTVDLGGVRAATWTFGDALPGTPIRASAGDLLRVTVDNQLSADTSVHWHGVRVRNVADGVPGVTQDPIRPGTSYRYEFTVPDPGTYWYHSHSGTQLDRGLYGPLIVEDPHEPGGYDLDWTVVLDDWTDGVGRSPDEILAAFRAQNGTVSSGMGGMGGMSGHGGMGGMSGMGGGTGSSPLGDAGDLAYPHYLINGRTLAAPTVLTGRPGQRARIRVINAAADTIFRLALAGHGLAITHADGYPVVRAQTGSVYLAMGERIDAVVTLGDGVFPLVAQAEGKSGRAFALVRTASGAAPAPDVPVRELAAPLQATSLRAAESARLPDAGPDATVDVQLNGQMSPYAWGLNGKIYGQDSPLTVRAGQRLRIRMRNMTMMAHPMHLHGHTWSLPGSGGLRKDTVLVLPMQTVEADLQADNPGAWAYHCHNLYHMEMGMMTTLRYA